MPKLNKVEADFLEIVKKGNLKNVETQIAKFKNLNVSICFTDENGRTPLHWAAEKGHAGVIKVLISEFAEAPKFNFKFHLLSEPWTLEGWLNWQDHKGQTALHLATANNHLDCVHELTANKITLKQLQIKNQAGDTPVRAATGVRGSGIWQHLNENDLTGGIQQTTGGKLATQATALWNSFYRVYRPVDLMRASVKKALAWLAVLTMVYAMIKGAFGKQTRCPNFFQSTSAADTLTPNFVLMASLAILTCVLQPLLDNAQVTQSSQNRLTR